MQHFRIALFVPSYLADPKLRVGLRDGVVLASLMSMPEAAVHKDARPVLPQHDVWLARQTWMVQPIAESMPPQIVAHQYLRLRILATDGCHVGMKIAVHLLAHLFQQERPIFSPVLAVLLKLYDVIADEPVAHGRHAVDSLDGRCPCSIMRGLNDGCQVAEGMKRVAPILKREFHSLMDVGGYFVCHMS